LADGTGEMLFFLTIYAKFWKWASKIFWFHYSCYFRISMTIAKKTG